MLEKGKSSSEAFSFLLVFLFLRGLLSGFCVSLNEISLGKAYLTVRFLPPLLVLLIALITGEEEELLPDFLETADGALLGLFSLVAATAY